MKELKDYFELALKFQGNKCPAMPMGLRAGLAGMKALGVERAKDKELIVVESETRYEDDSRETKPAFGRPKKNG